MRLKRLQAEYKEAISLLEEAVSIFTEKLGATHRQTVSSRDSLDRLRKVCARLSCLLGEPHALLITLRFSTN